MPATGKTPIQFYRSTTSGNVPSAADLSPGELALNIADNDMTMYFENASGVVKRFFNNPAELKYPTADGTSGQVVQTDGSKLLSFANQGTSAITGNTRQAVTSSATTTINLASGQVIDLTMAANIATLSFTNVPASGTPIVIQIIVKNASDGTAYTIAWPNSVYWSGQYAATTISNVQTAPTLASGANGVTIIALMTTDGGTKWRGWIEGTIPGLLPYSLYMWGTNSYGLLGQNDLIKRSSPTQVGSLTNWASVGVGFGHTVAVKTDGTLWAWGVNYHGNLGQNNLTLCSSPVQVGALTNWSQAVAGVAFTVALKTDGTIWTMGLNTFGRLGLNDAAPRSSPTQIGSLTTWSKISTKANGASTAAIKNDGTLWVWGLNNFGQLGQNDVTNRSSPVQVGSLTDWAEASAGANMCLAVKTNGTMWSWGQNDNWGQLGLNDQVRRSSPVQIGALTNWSKPAAGAPNAAAIKTDGTLWAWGSGIYGMPGQNDTVSRSSPVQVGALTNWSKVNVGNYSLLAIKTDASLWALGSNTSGKLGLNNRTNYSSPVQVGGLSWLSAVTGQDQSGGILNAISP